MDAFIYFTVKFFPIWSVAIMIIMGPILYNSILNRKYFSIIINLFIIFFLLGLLYIFIVHDGYNNAVPFIREYLF
jgi:hypothetical protein